MKIILTLTAFLLNLQLFSQIVNPTITRSDNPLCDIMQIGLTDSMTYVFLKYTNLTSNQTKLCIDENSCLKIKNIDKTFKLLSCMNIPIYPSYHIFDSLKQIHYFSVTYQPIPRNTKEIDIIGNINSDLNFYGVSMVANSQMSDSVDYIGLLEETPVKEKGYFYKDGKIVQYYIYKGLVIAMYLSEENEYGHYFTANISIENYTNIRIDFFPEKIYSIFYNSKIEAQYNAISYTKYIQKVKRKQGTQTFFVALGQTLAASSAGYSSSTTYNNTSGKINSNSFSSGFFGDSYGYVSSNVRTYANFTTSSATYNYDATANYYALQNAGNNIRRFIDQKYQINDIINQGYLKTNTIFPNQRINGYVNIDYKSNDYLTVVVPIKNETYLFRWPFIPENSTKKKSINVTNKSEDEKLIEKVLKDNLYTEVTYSDITEATIGDIVKFSSDYEDNIYGIITKKKGNGLLVIKTYPSIGQTFYFEKKYINVKHLKF